MHDLLVATAEIDLRDVKRYREADAAAPPLPSPGPSVVDTINIDDLPENTVAGPPTPADLPPTPPDLPPTPSDLPELAAPPTPRDTSGCNAAVAVGEQCEILQALAWAMSSNDDVLLLSVSRSLPVAVLDEQVRRFRAREPRPAAVAAPEPAPPKLFVRPHLLSHRMRAAAAYDAYLRRLGWDDGDRVPRNELTKFVAKYLSFGEDVDTTGYHRQVALKKWHKLWRSNTNLQLHTKLTNGKVVRGQVNRKRGLSNQEVPYGKRQRVAGTQGKRHRAMCVRERLYEWFISMRYSIDWKKYNAACRSRGRPKCVGRFPRSLLKAKLQEFLADYCHMQLVNGLRPTPFQITPQWFSGWENEFGLCMKQPNRKFKVPLWIRDERCLIAWLSVFRVRAACEAIFGYDPGMENFDQSPYHHNETGSKNVSTVAVAGMECPLVEGHADTRSRWTGNFTTFSEKSRILAGEMPYVEAMFKSDADSTTGGRRITLELRVREHIRSRGYGPWITVATSPKGSYRESDVLNFLERHLPPWEEGRRWRIILAVDFLHTSHLPFSGVAGSAGTF